MNEIFDVIFHREISVPILLQFSVHINHIPIKLSHKISP